MTSFYVPPERNFEIDIFGLCALTFAKDYFKRHKVVVSERASIKECAKLSYEFAKAMERERTKALIEITEKAE